MILQQRIKRFSLDPTEALNNFWLAFEFENLNQISTAITFYTRASERSNRKVLTYESLIRCANCFTKQEFDDTNTDKTLLKYAITELPQRPEAYYFYCLLLDKDKAYNELLMFSSIALTMSENNDQSRLMTDLGYEGYDKFIYFNNKSKEHLGIDP